MSHAPRAWQYALTGWTEIPSPIPVPQHPNEHRVLESFGYSMETAHGALGCGPTLRVFHRIAKTAQNEAYPYLGLLSLGQVHENPTPDAVQAVWFTDLPALLTFLKEFRGVFEDVRADMRWMDALLVMRKMFFATHGHEIYEDCARCEPGPEPDVEVEPECDNPQCPVHGKGAQPKERAH